MALGETYLELRQRKWRDGGAYDVMRSVVLCRHCSSIIALSDKGKEACSMEVRYVKRLQSLNPRLLPTDAHNVKKRRVIKTF